MKNIQTKIKDGEDQYNGAYYQDGNIIIGKNYNDFPTLAHELAHAIGTAQADVIAKYDTAEKFSSARCMGKGEAIYFITSLKYGKS